MDFEFKANSSKYHNVMRIAGEDENYGVIIDGDMVSLCHYEIGAALGADAHCDLDYCLKVRRNRDHFPEVMEEYKKLISLQSHIPVEVLKAFIIIPPEELLEKGWGCLKDWI